MDLHVVDNLPDVRYWSKILCCSIPTPHLFTDLTVKFTDFFMINEMFISHQSVIRKHSSFKYMLDIGLKFYAVPSPPHTSSLTLRSRSKTFS